MPCIFVNFWSSYVRSSMFWYGRQCVRQRSTYGLHYCNKNRPIRPRQIEIWSYSSRKMHQLTKCTIWANACCIQSAPCAHTLTKVLSWIKNWQKYMAYAFFKRQLKNLSIYYGMLWKLKQLNKVVLRNCGGAPLNVLAPKIRAIT